MTGLKDKVVIVTGGGSGIGRATALAFASLGAKVIITGRRAGPLRAVAAGHPTIAGLTADVSLPDDARRTVDETLNSWGRVDILVNNAGAGAVLPMAAATAEKIAGIFAANVLGPSLLSAAALPYLAATGGSIVNVSSTYGHRPAAGLSHYAASKAALEQLTRCWALELAPQAVRVNAVAPGPTESAALTGMMGLTPEQAEAVREQERAKIPLQRRGRPEDVARWIIALADPAADWITGQVITVDGGLELT
jgi:NAD(P)-dependent dehydrogenase (short-subunit alcohol dehydrogenase family)